MRPCLRAGLLACVTGLSLFADSAAVLPFANTSGASVPNAANLDWIGQSVAETIRETLGARGLITLDRETVEDAYRRLQLRPLAEVTEGSVLKLGEALDAELMIHGSFSVTPASAGTTSKGSLRIQARISDRRRFRQSPDLVETGTIEDLATLQAHLAWRALVFLAPAQAPKEDEFRSLRPPARLDALESYIRGLLARDIDQKEKFFNQALRLDPEFSHPALDLGKIRFERKEFRPAAELLEKIDPQDMHYREASFLLGLARYQSGDFPGAQRAFQIVAETVPLSEVYNNLGASENRQNLPHAVDSFRKALEGDPNDPAYHFNLGYALFKRGDFTDAADRFRAVLDRDPADSIATLLLGRCLKKQGLRNTGPDAAADARLQSLERLKNTYEEQAYRQLKSMLDAKTK
jgi:tetratricopeptide (TPR) repeat protein